MKMLIQASLNVLAITALAVTAHAEGVGIAETEITPDESAMFEVASTNKGALFPRMTTAQRMGIAVPAVGLLVYDTDVDAFFYRTAAGWEMIASSSSPVGSVTAFAGTTNNMPDGWLLCNGDELSSSNYPALYTAIGTTWGDASDDADPDTNFRVPDMRGQFLRGLNMGRSDGKQDPDGGSRTVGSYQGDQFKNHTHLQRPATGSNWLQVYQRGGGTWPDERFGNSQSSQTGSSGGTETRPKNVSVNYIIKY